MAGRSRMYIVYSSVSRAKTLRREALEKRRSASARVSCYGFRLSKNETTTLGEVIYHGCRFIAERLLTCLLTNRPLRSGGGVVCRRFAYTHNVITFLIVYFLDLPSMNVDTCVQCPCSTSISSSNSLTTTDASIPFLHLFRYRQTRSPAPFSNVSARLRRKVLFAKTHEGRTICFALEDGS